MQLLCCRAPHSWPGHNNLDVCIWHYEADNMILQIYLVLSNYIPSFIWVYDPSQYQFGSDVSSAPFAFNWSRGRGAMLTRAARRYACCVYTEQALILSDFTTKLLVTWIIVGTGIEIKSSQPGTPSLWEQPTLTSSPSSSPTDWK